MIDQSTIKADRSATIARHNDAFRKALKTILTPDGLVRGRVVVTRSVHDLPEQVYLAAVEKMRIECTFDAGNDPYGEHDFGSLSLTGPGCDQPMTFLWKIDYYADDSLEWGSNEPERLSATYRVLTLMLPEDY